MSEKNTGGAAFPLFCGKGDVSTGMSLRAYFAGEAMKGILSCWEAQKKICDTDPRYRMKPDGLLNFDEVVAKNSVEFADALIKELEK